MLFPLAVKGLIYLFSDFVCVDIQKNYTLIIFQCYLISNKHFLYKTENGGSDWSQVNIVEDEEEQKSRVIEDQLVFHPEDKFPGYVLLVDSNREVRGSVKSFEGKEKGTMPSVDTVKLTARHKI